MRRLLKVVILSIILLVLISVGLVQLAVVAEQDIIEVSKYEMRSGTAVVITGAAARIVQEAALLEKLQETGWLTNICFISGTSSGALNTVMLNAILENKFTWERYHYILFNLKNEDIFIRNGRSLPVNNQPFRLLLANVVNDSLAYKRIGDLPFQSSISISDVDLLPPFSKTYRLSNLKINSECNPNLNLVDALLASTAIPVLFPPARFNESCNLPNSSFVDGGFAEDHIPVEAVLQFEKYRGFGVDTLIIVSRKSDSGGGIKNEVQNFEDIDSRVFYKLGLWIDNLVRKGFLKSMSELQQHNPELAARTYVYIPDFEEDFALLDFSDLKKQYRVTIDWANSHKPIPLNQYLLENTRGNSASR